MLLQILIHTPRWVFAVFVLLVWLGCKQLVAGRVSLMRITLMPIVMAGLAIFGVTSAFPDSTFALAAWAACAVATGAFVLSRPLPPATRFDAGARAFHVAGSALPLVLMMGIFLTKYVVGVSFAMHPQWSHQPEVALGVSALYGVFTGSFAGRAARLWKLALRTDRAGLAAA